MKINVRTGTNVHLYCKKSRRCGFHCLALLFIMKKSITLFIHMFNCIMSGGNGISLGASDTEPIK